MTTLTSKQVYWRIVVLKGEARDSRAVFDRLLDRYDCGWNMLKTISPDAASAAAKYNEAMTELRRIDPHCPEFTPL